MYLQDLNDQALALLLICQQRVRTSNVTLATPKTAFVIGFNYKVSTFCQFLRGITDLGEYSAIFKSGLHSSLSRSAHQWEVTF